MESSEIADLLKPFVGICLSDVQLRNISIYIDILLRWNQRVNLTSVRKPDEIVTRHFGESLLAARQLFPRGNSRTTTAGFSPETQAEVSRLVDVGSGAGFPGLPIKIWAPELKVTLVESNHKKATFLHEVTRALRLASVDVFRERAEVFPVALASVVTLRAVEHFESILRVAARLVGHGGRLALLIGEGQLTRAIAVTPDFEWQTPIKIPLSTARVLAIGTSNQ